ncbi:MAG: hypothetical protein J6386_03015 [Candidatus Synoicihabitans palmerolidicus]|nr:hypothetical protein [Candidatus Synoicihabitans palmerolidicus]
MPIILDTSVDLNRQDLMEHMIQTSSEITDWTLPVTTEFEIPTDFVPVGERLAGDLAEIPERDPGKVQISTSWHKRYRIVKADSSHSSSNVVIPVQHLCKIRFTGRLFVAPDLSDADRTRLQNEFAYAAPDTPEIAAIVSRLHQAGISDDRYWVVPQSTISRYQRIEHDYYENRLFALRNGGDAGRYFDNTRIDGRPLPEWIDRNPLKVILEHQEQRPGVPPPANDAPREVPDEAAIPAIMDDLVNQAREVMACDNFVQRSPRKLIDLLAYPEFRVIWKRKRIKIDCYRITISYPQRQTRMTQTVLYFSSHCPSTSPTRSRRWRPPVASQPSSPAAS